MDEMGSGARAETEDGTPVLITGESWAAVQDGPDEASHGPMTRDKVTLINSGIPLNPGPIFEAMGLKAEGPKFGHFLPHVLAGPWDALDMELTPWDIEAEDPYLSPAQRQRRDADIAKDQQKPLAKHI
jgi:hypothetical protein